MRDSQLTVDAELETWPKLKDKHEWSGILLGNGASRAVWDDFEYASLYEKAASPDIENALSADDQALFQAFNTRNFERVLSALFTAELVNQSLSIECNTIRERYDSIRQALGDAVNTVHIPWSIVPQNTLDQFRSELRSLKFVYSTNYDLLLYWSVMSKVPRGEFTDFFWSKDRGQLIFDITNTEVWEGNQPTTRILYLHGGLHLYRLSTGETLKRTADQFDNLLDLFRTPYDGALPLFITEGSSKHKLESIHGSDYLAFAYSQFAQHEGDVIVFGHALAEPDAHIVDAMKSWGERRIAISLRNGDPAAIVHKKASLIDRLPRAKLHFFDAQTHPLGHPALRVMPQSPAEAPS